MSGIPIYGLFLVVSLALAVGELALLWMMGQMMNIDGTKIDGKVLPAAQSILTLSVLLMVSSIATSIFTVFVIAPPSCDPAYESWCFPDPEKRCYGGDG